MSFGRVVTPPESMVKSPRLSGLVDYQLTSTAPSHKLGIIGDVSCMMFSTIKRAVSRSLYSPLTLDLWRGGDS